SGIPAASSLGNRFSIVRGATMVSWQIGRLMFTLEVCGKSLGTLSLSKRSAAWDIGRENSDAPTGSSQHPLEGLCFSPGGVDSAYELHRLQSAGKPGDQLPAFDRRGNDRYGSRCRGALCPALRPVWTRFRKAER